MMRACQGPSNRAECQKKTEITPVRQRQPKAFPVNLTGFTVIQWPRSYLLHLAGEPLMAPAER